MARRQLLPAPEFNKVFCVHSKTDDISIDDWKSCFSEYGNILSVHVAKNKSTGQPTGIYPVDLDFVIYSLSTFLWYCMFVYSTGSWTQQT